MKKFILVLMLAVFAMPALKSDALTFTEKEHGFISVTVSSTNEVEPDTAEVSFSVETSAPTAQAAMKTNNEKTYQAVNGSIRIDCHPFVGQFHAEPIIESQFK